MQNEEKNTKLVSMGAEIQHQAPSNHCHRLVPIYRSSQYPISNNLWSTDGTNLQNFVGSDHLDLDTLSQLLNSQPNLQISQQKRAEVENYRKI